MRRWAPVVFLTVLGCGLVPVPGASQLPGLPISVELRAGGLVPLGDWDVRDRETTLRVGGGPSLSGVLRVELAEGLSVYGSYQWAQPSCQDCEIFALEGSLKDAGFGFGIGYVLPGMLPGAPRLDVGGISHQLTFRADGQTRPSERGLGGKAGMTLSFQIAPSLFLEPGLAGAFFPARFEFEDGDSREVSVRYLTPRIGLRYRL